MWSWNSETVYLLVIPILLRRIQGLGELFLRITIYFSRGAEKGGWLLP
jgi:hypothetical protein